MAVKAASFLSEWLIFPSHIAPNFSGVQANSIKGSGSHFRLASYWMPVLAVRRSIAIGTAGRQSRSTISSPFMKPSVAGISGVLKILNKTIPLFC